MTKITDKVYSDKRGGIAMILDSCKVGSISRIDSQPDSVRAQHYHLNDGHTIIVNEGQIELYEWPLNSEQRPTKIVLNKGDIHFTGPNVAHEMRFPCFTVFDCYSLLARDTANYEKETVRFPFSLEEIFDGWGPETTFKYNGKELTYLNV